MCKGRPLCADMNDLQWCKNTTNTNLEALLTPGLSNTLNRLIKCPLVPNSDDTRTNGQWIKSVQRHDGRVFHCLNRGDENPFDQIRSENGSNKNWEKLVEKPCENMHERRCLGNRPDPCIRAYRKF